MEINPGALPRPGRVPTQEFWSPKDCWRWRRRSELLLEKRGLESGFFPRGLNIGQRRAPGGPQGSQEDRWCGLGWNRVEHPPGPLVVALLPCFGYSRSFRSADFLYNFSGIYLALLMAGKPEI